MKPLKNIKKIRKIQMEIKGESNLLDAIDLLNSFFNANQNKLYERTPKSNESILITFLEKHYTKINSICSEFNSEPFCFKKDQDEYFKNLWNILFYLKKSGDLPGEDGHNDFTKIFIKATSHNQEECGNSVVNYMEFIDILIFSFPELSFFNKHDNPNQTMISLKNNILSDIDNFDNKSNYLTGQLKKEKYKDLNKIHFILCDGLIESFIGFKESNSRKAKALRTEVMHIRHLKSIKNSIAFIDKNKYKKLIPKILKLIKEKYPSKEKNIPPTIRYDLEIELLFKIKNILNIPYSAKIGDKTVKDFFKENINKSSKMKGMLKTHIEFEKDMLSEESSNEFNL